MLPGPNVPSKRPWPKWLQWLPFLIMLTLVLAGFGFGISRSGDGPDAADAKVLWWLDAKAAYSGDQAPRSWVTDQVMTLTVPGGVTGYGLARGEKRWTVPLAGTVCAASEQPSGGRIAIVHGLKDCNAITLIDLAGGKAVWTRPLPGRVHDPQSAKDQVAISGTTVMVLRGYDGITAMRSRDGRAMWRKRTLAPHCVFTRLAGGAAVLTEQYCKNGTHTVHRLDPAKGVSRWSHALTGDARLTGVLSTSPAVIVVDGKEVIALDDAGAATLRIPQDSSFGVRCDIAEVAWCRGAVVNGTRVFLRVPGKGDDVLGPSSISAYDVANGQRLWESDGSSSRTLIPVGFDGSDLIAAYPKTSGKKGYSDKPNAVVRIDPSNGRTSSSILDIPASLTGVDQMIEYHARPHYAGGRLYLVRDGRAKDPAVVALGVPA